MDTGYSELTINTSSLKELSAVVKDLTTPEHQIRAGRETKGRFTYKVDTRQLLEGLDSDTGEDTKSNLRLATAEAVEVGGTVALSQLVFDAGLDVVSLEHELVRAFSKASDLADAALRLFNFALEDQVTRTFGQEQKTAAQDEGPLKDASYKRLGWRVDRVHSRTMN